MYDRKGHKRAALHEEKTDGGSVEISHLEKRTGTGSLQAPEHQHIKEVSNMEYVTLNNGAKCPIVGIGTFMLTPADAENSVREALKMGYSLVDTANAYVNERACGRGIKGSGAAREDVFLSTKLWPSEYENENAVDETLDKDRRYYHRTDEQLAQFASWRPSFEHE